MKPFNCPLCGAFCKRAMAGKCSRCGTEWDNGSEEEEKPAGDCDGVRDEI